MEDMRLRAEEQALAERERESERARREGAAYRTPEQRAADARRSKAQQVGVAAKGWLCTTPFYSPSMNESPAIMASQGAEEDEAKTVDRRFDPSVDYYSRLGLLDRAASAAEVKRAYKRLALQYHPDKRRGEGAEAEAALAAQFAAIAEAFDVLADEAQRALYDKLRDHSVGGRVESF